MMRSSAPLLSFFVLIACAHADDASFRAFETGRYQEAFELAEASSATADRYAFQARSVLAHCIYQGGDPAPERLKQAEELARKALAADPDHVEGRLQLAIALSMQTRNMSLREIDRTGYGTASRDLAEEILQEDPRNAWANGFMSVWHIEARRVAGAFLAGMVGASLKKSEAFFEAAMAADPANLTLKWQYVRALMAFNPKRYEDEIMQGLQEIAAADPADALEEVLKARAVDYMPLMRARNYGQVSAIAIATV